jgi:Cu+-exporting ATPase
MKKVIFSIKGMHCTSCAMSIDGELEDTDGVINASTNYAKQKLDVEFDDAKISEQKIIEKVKEVGYTAEPLS